MKIEVTQDVLNYVDLIDQRFQDGVEKALSRFSIEWGRWSREMNVELRKQIERGDTQSVLYKYVFIYWITKSRLLEVMFASPLKLLKAGLKRRLAKECASIRKTILSGEMEDVSEDLESLLIKSVKK